MLRTWSSTLGKVPKLNSEFRHKKAQGPKQVLMSNPPLELHLSRIFFIYYKQLRISNNDSCFLFWLMLFTVKYMIRKMYNGIHTHILVVMLMLWFQWCWFYFFSSAFVFV